MIIRKCMLSLLIFFTIVEIVAATETKKIIIGACEWKPYTSIELANNGLLFELAEEALNRAGYQTELRFFPWKRAMEKAKIGQIDAVLGAAYTLERTQWFVYPNSLFLNEMIFFTQQGKDVKFLTFNNLAPATVGVIIGSKWIDRLKQIDGLKIFTVPSTENNFKMVVFNRIDYSIESRLGYEYQLRGNLSDLKDKLQLVLPPFHYERIFLIISKKNPAFNEIRLKFNSALDQMKEDGYIKKIHSKYGLSD